MEGEMLLRNYWLLLWGKNLLSCVESEMLLT